LIEANAMTEAGSLILSLKKDPVFPERLSVHWRKFTPMVLQTEFMG
jgi:hypothetical protein